MARAQSTYSAVVTSEKIAEMHDQARKDGLRHKALILACALAKKTQYGLMSDSKITDCAERFYAFLVRTGDQQ